MTPTSAFASIREATGGTFETELQTIRTAWLAAKEDARKANRVIGILEACLRDIHAVDPKHKSAIECAWSAVNRVG